MSLNKGNYTVIKGKQAEVDWEIWIKKHKGRHLKRYFIAHFNVGGIYDTSLGLMNCQQVMKEDKESIILKYMAFKIVHYIDRPEDSGRKGNKFSKKK